MAFSVKGLAHVSEVKEHLFFSDHLVRLSLFNIGGENKNTAALFKLFKQSRDLKV